MKQKAVYILLVAFLAISLAGCGKKSGKEVLASVDKKDIITVSAFNDRISKLPERYQGVVNKNKKQFLDELVVDVLLYNEAMRKGLDKDAEVRKILAEAKKKIVIARLLKDEIEDKIKITDEDIQGYYDANKEKFTTPEMRRASHILVKTEKEANEILVELSNGRNFEELARARSVDPTAKAGGDIGYFTRQQLVPEIEQAVFNMRVGEKSGIVKTKFGYHIIKLTEIQKPRIKKLSEVRDGVEQALRRIKKRVLFNEYVSDLKEKAKIYINKDLLLSISEEENSGKNPED